MSNFNLPMPHGNLIEVFPEIFFVTGTYKGEFFDSMWQFSRNMTVVRDGSELTLINSVRLDDESLSSLDALGKVVNVVKIGSMHGHDDDFYLNHYNATFWALPGMPAAIGPNPGKELAVDATTNRWMFVE
jgi:hypothetical protein